MKFFSLKLSLLPAFLISLAACDNIEKKQDLKGEWIELGSPYVQGFELKADLFSKPKARSIGSQTLQYDSWELKGDELVLRGKSIGNHSSFDFQQRYQLLELDDDEMILRRGELVLKYAKVKTVKGTVSFADEVRTFQEEGEEDVHWLIDRSGKLLEEYVNYGVSHWKKNCTLKVIELDDNPAEFGKAYDGSLMVIDVL